MRTNTEEETQVRNAALPENYRLVDAMHFHGDSARVEILVTERKEILLFAQDSSADKRFRRAMLACRPTTRINDCRFYWYCGESNSDIPGTTSNDKAQGVIKQLQEGLEKVDVSKPPNAEAGELFTAQSSFTSASKFHRLSDLAVGVKTYKYDDRSAGVFGPHLDTVESFFSSGQGDRFHAKGKFGKTWVISRQRYMELLRRYRPELT